MIDINLTGMWHACKAAIPHLIAGGRGGSIVITSSTAGLRGLPNLAHYVSAKHGVVGLMRTLALELAPHFIRVNSLHPSTVNTNMIQNEATYRLFRPDLQNPGPQDMAEAATADQLPTLSKRALEGGGFAVIERREPSLLADGSVVTAARY
jgi:NAD(P)-dependent dehydrogenase (short-subunit alcohol dehydrogenase family)